MFEILALLMCTFAIAVVLWPLSKSESKTVPDDEQAFLKAQLLDVDERIATKQGDANALQEERTEIARRLLRADRTSHHPAHANPVGRKALTATSLVSIIAIPALAAALYFYQGAPGVADAPLSAKSDKQLRNLPIEQLVARAEAQLKKDPNDIRGWTVLERVYARLGRVDEQRNALVQIIRLDGETAPRLSLLAELIAVQQGNVINNQAKQLIDRALVLDPAEPRTRYLSGIAAEQEGDFVKALAMFKGLLAQTQSGASLEPVLKQRIASLQSRLGTPPSGTSGPLIQMPKLDAQTIENANEMSSSDRAEMIKGMIARLAERLESEPDDSLGWQRLINAYLVSGDLTKAGAALDRARGLFADDVSTTKTLDILAKRLTKLQAGQQ